MMRAHHVIAGAVVALVASPPPTRLAPGTISTAHEFTITFTPDGREAYFTRYNAQPRWMHVMHAVVRDGEWQPPAPVAFSSDAWFDLDPFLSPDGSRLYFVSTRPRPDGASNAKPDMDIWYADRSGDGWGAPHWIAELSSDGKEGSPTVDRAGNICFFSDRGSGADKNAIYCAERRGDHWDRPVRLDTAVNAGPSDTSPFLAPDGNTLLFYSTRPGGRGGADLYMSIRARGAWQPAVNLGDVVNTAESEYNPSVSPDGRTLYFGRNGDIWTIPVSEVGAPELTPARFR